jgi:hypothetical protein
MVPRIDGIQSVVDGDMSHRKGIRLEYGIAPGVEGRFESDFIPFGNFIGRKPVRTPNTGEE